MKDEAIEWRERGGKKKPITLDDVFSVQASLRLRSATGGERRGRH